MKAKWMEIRKGADFGTIASKFHISPITARLIRNKNIVGDEAIEAYLHGGLEQLHDGILMKDMKKAVDIISEKIQHNQKIRIIGDYDIDGVNATYILLEGLQRIGANVDSDIPHRMKEGYGLNIELIERAVEAGIDTIITCDNGIAAKGEIAYAKEQGMTVIVTDHHEVPYEDEIVAEEVIRTYLLPDADAVIDPKQANCEYPFKNLCGAAVAYKFIECLYQVMGEDPEDVDDLMEQVAIATIGDVMDLDGENRIFVKQGLEMLKRTKNIGLNELLELTVPDRNMLNAYKIGFVIGPCMNACGRLDTAKRALELMCIKEKKQAQLLASELVALNENRKNLTDEGVKQAIEIVERELLDDKILVVFLPDCHESLAGIIAGRIRERYYKPTFVLTRGESGVKGSGRSIDAYHMYEELNKCKDLFTKYGGHKLAAGLSMEEKNVNKFRRTLNQISTLTQDDLTETMFIDMQVAPSYMNETVIEELSYLEPFGKGNTKPHFAEKDLEIIQFRVVGKNQNVVKLRLKEMNGYTVEAVCFNGAEKMEQDIIDKYGNRALDSLKKSVPAGVKFAMIYYPEINEYQGRRTVQVNVQHYRC